MNFPGQIQRPFLCHTFNEGNWQEAEYVYSSNNNNYVTMVAASENIAFGTIALHLLTKLDNGTFRRDLIQVDAAFINHYRNL